MLLKILFESRENYVAQQIGQKLINAFNRDSGKKPNIQNPTPLDIVKYLGQAGPKYISWIANQYAKRAFLLEDLPQIKQDIIRFTQLSKTNVIKNKDLNSYKSVQELRAIFNNASIAGAGYKGKFEKLYQALNVAVKEGHGKWLYNTSTDPIKIYIPTDETGSVCIRRAYPDVSWCTTHDEDEDTINAIIDRIVHELATAAAEEYLETLNKNRHQFGYNRGKDYDEILDEMIDKFHDLANNGELDKEIEEARANMHNYYMRTYGGEFYVILTPNGIFQFHFESDQFKDSNDNDINVLSFLKNYPSVRNILGPIAEEKGDLTFISNPTKQHIINALKRNWSNSISKVNLHELNIDDWKDITLEKVKSLPTNTKGVISAESKPLFASIQLQMKAHGFSDSDVVNVIEYVISKNKFKIKKDGVPSWILQLINDESQNNLARLF